MHYVHVKTFVSIVIYLKTKIGCKCPCIGCLKRTSTSRRANHGPSTNSFTSHSANTTSQPASNNALQDVETSSIAAAIPSPSNNVVEAMVGEACVEPHAQPGGGFLLNGAPPDYNESNQLPLCEVGSLPAYYEGDPLPRYEDDDPTTTTD